APPERREEKDRLTDIIASVDEAERDAASGSGRHDDNRYDRDNDDRDDDDRGGPPRDMPYHPPTPDFGGSGASPEPAPDVRDHEPNHYSPPEPASDHGNDWYTQQILDALMPAQLHFRRLVTASRSSQPEAVDRITAL